MMKNMEARMEFKITLGDNGQIILPKSLCDQVGIQKGVELNLSLHENVIKITPQKTVKEIANTQKNEDNNAANQIDSSVVAPAFFEGLL